MTPTEKTEKIINLAASMFQFACEIAEQPFAGSGKESSEINLRWMNTARMNLHDFLVINAEHLDQEWTDAMIAHSATEESFDEYFA